MDKKIEKQLEEILKTEGIPIDLQEMKTFLEEKLMTPIIPLEIFHWCTRLNKEGLVDIEGDRWKATSKLKTKIKQIKLIPVNKIEIPEKRIHSRLDKKRQELLESSMKSFGLLLPIIVRKQPIKENYRLVCGENRLKVFKDLNREFIPAIVLEPEEGDDLIYQIIENVARGEYDPVEVADLIDEWVKKGRSIFQLARILGAKHQWLYEVRFLKQIPEEYKEKIREGELHPVVAAKIAKKFMGDEYKMKKALKKAEGTLPEFFKKKEKKIEKEIEQIAPYPCAYCGVSCGEKDAGRFVRFCNECIQKLFIVEDKNRLILNPKIVYQKIKEFEKPKQCIYCGELVRSPDEGEIFAVCKKEECKKRLEEAIDMLKFVDQRDIYATPHDWKKLENKSEEKTKQEKTEKSIIDEAFEKIRGS